MYTHDKLRSDLLRIAEEYLKECGCCGCYHFKWFEQDCRDDTNRFGPPEDLVELWLQAPRLLEASRVVSRLLEEMTSEEFSKGKDKVAREYLAEVVRDLA